MHLLGCVYRVPSCIFENCVLSLFVVSNQPCALSWACASGYGSAHVCVLVCALLFLLACVYVSARTCGHGNARVFVVCVSVHLCKIIWVPVCYH